MHKPPDVYVIPFADKEFFPLDDLAFSLFSADRPNGLKDLVSHLKPAVVAMSKTILPII